MADSRYYRPRGGRGFRGRNRIDKRYHGGPHPSLNQLPGNVIRSSRLPLDEDVQMNGQNEELGRLVRSQNHRFDVGGGRYQVDRRRDRGAGRGRGFSPARGSVAKRLGPVPLTHHYDNNNDWYKVLVLKGKAMAKDFIMSAINGLTDVKFEPLNFHEDGPHAVFFVKSKAAAMAINETSDRITLPDSSKMIIKTTRLNSRPPTVLTKEVVENLTLCMNRRYDVAALTLDMSDLYNDPDLRKNELYLDLNLQQVVDRVLGIIGEHIPGLKRLDLSNNRLRTVKAFAPLAQKAPQLSCLTLANNALQSDRDVLCLDKLPLEELTLDGNPLCKNFRDKQLYISAIRKHFQKILRLDGMVLPPPITFDTETPTTLPPAKGSHFMNEQFKNLICLFINKFFEVYDSDSRQALLDLYHPQVTFSLSVFGNKQGCDRTSSWSEYQTNDRNLKSIKDAQKRLSQLKRGNMEVVNLLNKLPHTQHSPESFTVDVNAATNAMLTFTVQGVFRERSNKTNPKLVRKMTRTFITIPSTNILGVMIVNDMLNVTLAASDAYQKYFAGLAAPAASAASGPSAAQSTGVDGLTDIQQKMIVEFSAQSGMNVEWSARCLKENSWNYEEAAKNFLQLHESLKIPPEAFV